MSEAKKRKKRAMTSQKASFVKKQGHLDAKEFAKLIGLQDDYQNDPKAKKDVIDFNGDGHSLKSGKGYWQVFLYGKSRFDTDSAFKAMNGIGQIMLQCINTIPNDKTEYEANKKYYKQQLSLQMIELCKKFDEKYRVEQFLRKSIFEGTQVSYLTIKHNDIFHVFWHDDVIEVFLQYLTIANSTGENGPQKVLFKLNGKNCGEIEMRNGEDSHHKEMKFRLHKVKITNLLIDKITNKTYYNEKICVYGKAIKKFLKK